MFSDFWNLAARAEAHRADLLADAEVFRLGRSARRARRRAGREPTAAAPPRPAPADRTRNGESLRDDGAQRRYAVPR